MGEEALRGTSGVFHLQPDPGRLIMTSHNKRLSILGSMYLSYEELGNVHWHALLGLP